MVSRLHLDDILREYEDIAEKTGKGLYIQGELGEVLYHGLKKYIEEQGYSINWGYEYPNKKEWYVVQTDLCQITITPKYEDFY
ncbi:MAG: hypothetical protein ACOCRX_08715 [Candidatus Woesearchaeota archaeon]